MSSVKTQYEAKANTNGLTTFVALLQQCRSAVPKPRGDKWGPTKVGASTRATDTNPVPKVRNAKARHGSAGERA
ncbi:MAG TPA: hypothetical protein VH088_21135, partial [Terriglobales bacterium]|nr:hypothetical protein [Terriglobales bacterium]